MSWRKIGTDLVRDCVILSGGAALGALALDCSYRSFLRGVGAALVFTLVIHVIGNLFDYTDSLADERRDDEP